MFRYYLLAMASQHLTHFVVVGAGAAGLMTARELARAGKRVTILEAKTRRGGRIYPLPSMNSATRRRAAPSLSMVPRR